MAVSTICSVMDSVSLTITESKGVIVKTILGLSSDICDVTTVLDCLDKGIKSADLVVH